MSVQLRERNVVQKDWRKVQLRVALCYPNNYQVGMTSLAIHLLYALFNRHPGVACERVFYVPGEAARSLESGQVLSKFDVVAFSLQFETDFVNAVEMLQQSGVLPLAVDRHRPWVIAGGPCATANLFPMLPFVDVFLVGDFELVYHELLDALIKAENRSELDSLLGPHFFLPERVTARRALVTDLDAAFHPTCQLLPEPPYPPELEPTFGRSLLLEISRGCDRRCNFCLTTYQCSPRRERSLSTLLKLVEDGSKCTGVEKIALLASGFTDHSDLEAILTGIVNREKQLSVPSLRADLHDGNILETIYAGGQRTLTFAPEAGSERLRTLIGKSIADDTFNQIFRQALTIGFNLFKLYFMIGLPTETDEDIQAIYQFCVDLHELAPKRHRLHVSIAPFIPKAHTPYQWVGLTPVATLKKRIRLLEGLRRLGRVQLDLPNPRWGVIQAALSRGTSGIAPVINVVARNSERTASTWFNAAKEVGLNLEALATADYSPEVQFPWDRIDVGVKRNTLLQQFSRLEL